MSSDLEALRDYLRDRDTACPGCGYNVRGLDAGACPECGRRLRVALVGDGRPSAWWFGLFGLAAGMVGAGLVALFVIGDIVMDGGGDEPEALLTSVLLILALGGQGAALSRWIVRGRPGIGAALLAWVIGFGPLLGLWGTMLLLMAIL